VAAGDRPGPERRRRPFPAPDGIRQGEHMRGRGNGGAGPGGCFARGTGWLLMQVGLKNALNSIARLAILGALERLCPSMTSWVRQALQPAPLLVGREPIWSTGVLQQGVPPGLLSVCRGHPSRPRRPAAGGHNAQMVTRRLRVHGLRGGSRGSAGAFGTGTAPPPEHDCQHAKNHSVGRPYTLPPLQLCDGSPT